MEKRYVVMVYVTQKDTEITDRYCHIMNDAQYDHFKRSEGLHYSPWKLTDNGTFEKETPYTYEKIVVNCMKPENIKIHNEIYIG